MSNNKPAWNPGQPAPDGYHEVQTHIRRNPGAAQPHWMCVLVSSANGQMHYATLYSLEPVRWRTGLPANPRLFLRNDLKQVFKDEIEAGVVLLLRP